MPKININYSNLLNKRIRPICLIRNLMWRVIYFSKYTYENNIFFNSKGYVLKLLKYCYVLKREHQKSSLEITMDLFSYLAQVSFLHKCNIKWNFPHAARVTVYSIYKTPSTTCTRIIKTPRKTGQCAAYYK
mgnify:CR=1 FL=1